MSLDKAKKEIEGLKSTVSNLETSLAASKERRGRLHSGSLEVRSGARIAWLSVYVRRSSRFDRLPIRSEMTTLLYSRVDAGSRFFYFAG